MDIVVILRQVPDTEADISIDPADKTIILDDDIKWILNPYDEYAVEAAVSLAEENDGEVNAICIGKNEAEQVIRTAMAMGVNTGLLINDDLAINTDIIAQARIIAKIFKENPPDLVLCGREFIDTNEDAMGAALAEFLGTPHVLNVSKLTFDGKTLNVEREVDGGTLRIEMQTPAVVSCQKGLNEPRYPNLMAVRRARKKTLDIKSLDDLGIDTPDSGIRLVQLVAPPVRAEGKLVEGEPSDTARQAVDWLHNEARAL
ncbi:electron transfer flavoprotein subunit beta/FixA family protein [bacterium]|nr:electron transfer flavoprotein subunit beta/FixA family protein [bacterium]